LTKKVVEKVFIQNDNFTEVMSKKERIKLPEIIYQN
jgi:hypothetical protein